MKKYLIAVFAVCLAGMLLLLALPVLAGGPGSAHDSGTTSAAVVCPADPGRHTTVTAFSATSDQAGSALSVYWSDGVSTSVDTDSTGTTLNVADTTGFAQNNLIAIQSPDGRVIWRSVSSVSAGESLTLATALSGGLGAKGDTVTLLAASSSDADASIPVGAAQKELVGAAGIIIGPAGSPILLSLTGSSACSVDYLTWDFK